ncbi:MAG: cytochrome b/b6 domain-containing protein [Caulobacteraceae bacterium]|nr:cytochrome b/b6 domain-containing protein [Caulobacteraceae bacterium]
MVKIRIRRHSLPVRIAHWVNAAAFVLLLASGLQIFNAHPALYWGQKSDFDRPWVAMTPSGSADGRLIGVTEVAGRRFDTTNLLGVSDGQARGFPAWATLPSYRSLAEGRRWHFAMAWLFAINGALYLLWTFLSGHLFRDLWPTREQSRPRHIFKDILDHARLRFPKGEEARRYNVIQKWAYLAVILVLLPLMVLTGLCMSPGFNAVAPWLVEAFGGRQSARTIHFLSASGLVLFFLVHLSLVALSGLWNNLRSMVTGRYAIEVGE